MTGWLGKVPVVFNIVGAIFAMVRGSAELEEELRLNDGRDDRLDVLVDDLISSMSSSDSSWITASCGSSTATHCSTNVLKLMCLFPFG